MIDPFEEQRLSTAFGCFFLGITIILLILTQGCSSNIPAIDVTLWAGNSTQESISRSQSNQNLLCKDPDFDNYVCMTYSDLQKVYETMLKCKQWNVNTMTPEEEFLLVKKNREVIRHVLPRREIKKLESLLN
jgi:hypothetical protein